MLAALARSAASARGAARGARGAACRSARAACSARGAACSARTKESFEDAACMVRVVGRVFAPRVLRVLRRVPPAGVGAASAAAAGGAPPRRRRRRNLVRQLIKERTMTCPTHSINKICNFPRLVRARARSICEFNAWRPLPSSHGCGQPRCRAFAGPPGVRTARPAVSLNDAPSYTYPDVFCLKYRPASNTQPRQHHGISPEKARDGARRL